MRTTSRPRKPETSVSISVETTPQDDGSKLSGHVPRRRRKLLPVASRPEFDTAVAFMHDGFGSQWDPNAPPLADDGQDTADGYHFPMLPLQSESQAFDLASDAGMSSVGADLDFEASQAAQAAAVGIRC